MITILIRVVNNLVSAWMNFAYDRDVMRILVIADGLIAMRKLMLAGFFVCCYPLWAMAGESVTADEVAADDIDARIRRMDANHDGMVSITEMRAYLEKQHGKGYQHALLDEIENRANSKSCASPFSRSLY